ncbi:putative ribosomal protein L19 [Dioscorea sansibarensis]
MKIKYIPVCSRAHHPSTGGPHPLYPFFLIFVLVLSIRRFSPASQLNLSRSSSRAASMAALLHPLLPLPAPPPPRLAVVASLRPSLFSSIKLSISRSPSLCLGSSKVFRRSDILIARASTEEGDGAVAEEVETLEDVVVDEEDEEEGEGESSEAEAEERPPRKPRIKLGDIMGILNKRAVEASEQVRPVPDLRTGDIVEIKLEVPENRKRLSVYKGIVMSKQNAGIHTTIRIRRIIAGVGVEIVFPVYSPNIKEIKVVQHRKVRRARLYYLRDKLPRLSTFK